MNARTALAAGHPGQTPRIPSQPPPEDAPITEPQPCDADRCGHIFPDCERIRCVRPTHVGGICHNVQTNPYRACYWQQPGGRPA